METIILAAAFLLVGILISNNPVRLEITHKHLHEYPDTEEQQTEEDINEQEILAQAQGFLDDYLK